MTETPESLNSRPSSLPAGNSVVGGKLSGRKTSSRNQILSWGYLELNQKNSITPALGTESDGTQGLQKQAKSLFRHVVSLGKKVFYLIFKFLFELAKFFTRIISTVRESWRR